jgi:hypothetical protein
MILELICLGLGVLCFLIAAGFCLSASYAASRPTPPLFTKFSTRRQPGETDSAVYDRLLNASPYHQNQMPEVRRQPSDLRPPTSAL